MGNPEAEGADPEVSVPVKVKANAADDETVGKEAAAAKAAAKAAGDAEAKNTGAQADAALTTDLDAATGAPDAPKTGEDDEDVAPGAEAPAAAEADTANLPEGNDATGDATETSDAEADDAPASDNTDKNKTVAEKATAVLGQLGESMRNASKGLLEWVAGQAAKDKQGVLSGVMMSGTELLLRLMIGKGGKGLEFINEFSKTQLDFIEAKIGLHVEKGEEGEVVVTWVAPDENYVPTIKFNNVLDMTGASNDLKDKITTDITYEAFVAMTEASAEGSVDGKSLRKMLSAMKNLAGDKPIEDNVKVRDFIVANYSRMRRELTPEEGAKADADAEPEEGADTDTEADADADADTGAGEDADAEPEEGADTEEGAEAEADAEPEEGADTEEGVEPGAK